MSSPSTLSRLLGGRANESLDLVDEHLQANVLHSLFETAPPAKFDRFVLLEPVGGGAMGTVFAAYDPKLDRRIALKVMRSGDELGRKRHLAEARALARVNHPNVVAVHDAGEHGDSLYVAMELVEGTSLATHLEQQQLPVRQIVRLFTDAARGLAAAHAAGVVHRDFKPANVLVGTDGRVRVADFGLAKAAAASPAPEHLVSGDDADSHTVAGAGTPLYMAPEQTRGESVDARSDQFAFFVALVEALTGEVPFASRTALERLEKIDAGLGTTARPIPRSLLRLARVGLSPRPSERFADMDAVATALTKHEQRPRRWVMGVLASATVGAVWTVMRGAVPVEPCSEQPLQSEWDARREGLRQAFSNTQQSFADESWKQTRASLDRYVDDWTDAATAACRATRVTGEHSERVLDLRMACLDQRRAQLRATWDILARVDETTVFRAARVATTLPSVTHCDRVETLLAVDPLPDDPEARTIVDQAREELAAVRALRQIWPNEARARLERAQQLSARVDYVPLSAEVDLNLGFIELEAGEFDTARTTMQRAMWAAVATRHDEVGAVAAQAIARSLMAQSQYDQAADWLEMARAVYRRTGVADGTTSHVANQEAELALRRGRPTEALPWARRSIALADTPREEVLGRSRLAAALAHAGSMDEALAEYEVLLEMAEDVWGSANPNLASMMTTYGAQLAKAGQVERGLALMEDALQIVRAVHGDDHPMAETIHSHMATALARLGRYDEAIVRYEAYGSALAGRVGSHHPEVAMNHVNIASALRSAERPAEALEQCRRGGRLLRPDADRTFFAYVAMCEATSLLMLDRAPEALQIIEPFAKAPDPDTRVGLRESIGQAYVEALYQTGQVEEAIRHAEASVPFIRDAHGLEPGELSVTERWLRSVGH